MSMCMCEFVDMCTCECVHACVCMHIHIYVCVCHPVLVINTSLERFFGLGCLFWLVLFCSNGSTRISSDEDGEMEGEGVISSTPTSLHNITTTTKASHQTITTTDLV